MREGGITEPGRGGTGTRSAGTQRRARGQAVRGARSRVHVRDRRAAVCGEKGREGGQQRPEACGGEQSTSMCSVLASSVAMAGYRAGTGGNKKNAAVCVWCVWCVGARAQGQVQAHTHPRR